MSGCGDKANIKAEKENNFMSTVFSNYTGKNKNDTTVDHKLNKPYYQNEDEAKTKITNTGFPTTKNDYAKSQLGMNLSMSKDEWDKLYSRMSPYVGTDNMSRFSEFFTNEWKNGSMENGTYKSDEDLANAYLNYIREKDEVAIWDDMRKKYGLA